MIADIKFECTECGQPIAVDSAAAGRSASCPACSNQFVVPAVGSINDRNYGAAPRKLRRGGMGTPGGLWQDLTVRELEVGSDVPATDVELLHPERHTDIEGSSPEIDDLRQQVEALREESERWHATAIHLQAELKSFQVERLTLRNELVQLRQRLSAIDADLAKRNEALLAAEEAAVQTRGQCANLQSDLLVARQRVAAMETQLVARERQAAEFHQQLATSRISEHSALRQVESLQAESALVRAELDSVRTELAEAASLEARKRELEGTVRESEQNLLASKEEVRSLTLTCHKLRAEAESVHRALRETKSGRSLIDLRSRLDTAEDERSRLKLELRQALEEAAKREESHRKLEVLIMGTRRQLHEAVQKADASSESRIVSDNEILRGIVSRQNAELQTRQAEILCFKRARFGVRVLYTLLAIAMTALLAALLYALPLII